MMTQYEKIFENNRKWAASRKASNARFFEKLAEGQDPDFLYIGCSDSRVSAEEMMGADPGEIFVHRNIANVVQNTDLNVMSVINYAIGFLKVKHVVVCGHYECGGVRAAMEPQDHGILNPWLRNIRDVYRLHKTELNAIVDQEMRYRRLIELNVVEQCTNVIKTAVLQKSYLENGYPVVHGWVFDVASGELIDLKLNFEKKLEEIQEIYDLRR
jgi:carbonic anhydrase